MNLAKWGGDFRLPSSVLALGGGVEGMTHSGR